MPEDAAHRALVSLEGLSVGDAFGECLFSTTQDSMPAPPWGWTDDTEMALSVVGCLMRDGAIDQDRLAADFAARYSDWRGYGPSMHRVLARIGAGEDWRAVTRESFSGQGSFGNGGAMRSGPLGAWFADDLDRAAAEAALAAEVTHAHPEGVAGAVAVTLAAGLAASGESLTHEELLKRVVDRLPDCEVRTKLRRAESMTDVRSVDFPVSVLGNGTGLSAQDTVPFALWCCGQHPEDYEAAVRLATSAGGDRDTLGAIVGSVVACRVGIDGIPQSWKANREPLPDVNGM